MSNVTIVITATGIADLGNIATICNLSGYPLISLGPGQIPPGARIMIDGAEVTANDNYVAVYQLP